MSGNEVKLANGRRWTAQQFVDHYLSARIGGTPTPVGDAPAPIPVDMPWYMAHGPGRFYHPGMFPIVNEIIDNRKLAPGTYDLWKLAPKNKEDPAVKATISNYTTEPFSADYKTRALVFGNESARISGQVVVNQDGSKTFKGVEIKPLDSNFDFERNTRNYLLEAAREAARRYYDPRNQGITFEIPYRGLGRLDDPLPDSGIGRIYHPFTDSQLKAALCNPASTPPGLLPSFTAAPPPAIKEHLRHLDQTGGNGPKAAAPSVGGGPTAAPSANRNPLPSDIGNWVASLAGVDPANPMLPQQGTSIGGDSSKQRLLPPWVFFGSP
ncbi:hypothetical protein V1277_000898 [Bradyrhizobium sp. AZCC 1588]|uniref:hypothetical protein n=1 Tax=unclassified Bradyrhizobium TaxID=2631580 RepID=UPI002FF21D39